MSNASKIIFSPRKFTLCSKVLDFWNFHLFWPCLLKNAKVIENFNFINIFETFSHCPVHSMIYVTNLKILRMRLLWTLRSQSPPVMIGSRKHLNGVNIRFLKLEGNSRIVNKSFVLGGWQRGVAFPNLCPFFLQFPFFCKFFALFPTEFLKSYQL